MVHILFVLSQTFIVRLVSELALAQILGEGDYIDNKISDYNLKIIIQYNYVQVYNTVRHD